jgi:hypothetical protein
MLQLEGIYLFLLKKMTTKKLISPIDLEQPSKIIKGFLYPNFDSEKINSFIELNKEKEWKTGIVVFTGKDINKSDLFAKIVDSGKKIKSVNDLLNNLENYLIQIKSFKIGDVVGVKETKEGFEIFKIEKNRQ